MITKQMRPLIVLNVFLVLLGGIIVRCLTTREIQSLGHSVQSHLGTTVSDIKKSNFLTLQSYLTQTIATAKSSVVSISISKDVKFYVDDPSQLNGPGNIQQQTTTIGGGSGILISKKGYILTNKHVVQDTEAKYSVTLADGRTYHADKIWFDDVLDIAILKIIDTDDAIPPDLTPAVFVPLQDTVEIGQFVLSIGNALGKYPWSVSMGILGGKGKNITVNGNNLYIGLYQTDAQANPGNSGGPLLDIEGHTLGVITAIDEGEGLSFALPLSAEFIASTIASLEKFGTITRPIIGLQYQEITPSLQEQKHLSVSTGIYITDTLTDLPAWEAGIKAGDIITAINGISISTQLPFLYQLYTFIPGDTITATIIRGNERLSLPVVLGGNTK